MSVYSLRLTSFLNVNKIHMALSDAYRAGYDGRLYSTNAAVQSALSKLPE
jgi:hypothetical protein